MDDLLFLAFVQCVAWRALYGFCACFFVFVFLYISLVEREEQIYLVSLYFVGMCVYHLTSRLLECLGKQLSNN